MQARKNCHLWLNCHFPSIPMKHLYVHRRKTSSCPLFSCYYEFTASVCWAGVMIMHGTTRWYTKLVLTTGSLVDSLPPDHHIYHTTHITQNSSPPPGKSGRKGGMVWREPKWFLKDVRGQEIHKTLSFSLTHTLARFSLRNSPLVEGNVPLTVPTSAVILSLSGQNTSQCRGPFRERRNRVRYRLFNNFKQ